MKNGIAEGMKNSIDLSASSPVICPAILAGDKEAYRKQIKNVAHTAHRIQIDLTDGIFASHKTIGPEDAWWPVGFKADFHLMFNDPMPAIRTILRHKPHTVIIHAEAEGSFRQVVESCRHHGVRVGVALLPKTSPHTIFSALEHINHVLIFSGDLGRFGGQADLRLLDKVQELKQRKPELEIGWDGGVNAQNVAQLVFGGVDVLNVGGYIQGSDDPERAFHALERIAEETGTT
jgi:ribulose-phosphate 3-epimerase